MERNISQSERADFGSSTGAFLDEAAPKTSALSSLDSALSSQTMVSDGKLPAFEIAQSFSAGITNETTVVCPKKDPNNCTEVRRGQTIDGTLGDGSGNSTSVTRATSTEFGKEETTHRNSFTIRVEVNKAPTLDNTTPVNPSDPAGSTTPKPASPRPATGEALG